MNPLEYFLKYLNFQLVYAEATYKVQFNGKFSSEVYVKQGLIKEQYSNLEIVCVVHEKLCNGGIELRLRLGGDNFNLDRLKAKSK